MLIILHILTFPIARIFEAWMDAIDFRYGALPMPLLWHLLKYPMYIFTVAHGYLLAEVFRQIGWWIIVNELVSVGIAWMVFEFALAQFRRYYGSRTLHDLKKQHKD